MYVYTCVLRVHMTLHMCCVCVFSMCGCVMSVRFAMCTCGVCACAMCVRVMHVHTHARYACAVCACVHAGCTCVMCGHMLHVCMLQHVCAGVYPWCVCACGVCESVIRARAVCMCMCVRVYGWFLRPVLFLPTGRMLQGVSYRSCTSPFTVAGNTPYTIPSVMAVEPTAECHDSLFLDSHD